MDAEKAHYRVMNTFKLICKLPFAKPIIKKILGYDHPSLEKEFLGIKFKNPIGLAAGFDKDGRYIDELALLGFGFIEVGTVTPRPQEGNPKPRLFRLPKDKALINRMGFNNKGLDQLVERLKKVKSKDIVIGGNIGKNKTTPNEEAYKDYKISFEKLHPYVDYFVVNVSSPNTPGLRALQEKEPLTKLLKSLIDINLKKEKQKPILLKIAPDLNPNQLDDIAEISLTSGIDGLIVSNTTIDRDNLTTSNDNVQKIGAGGLSGAPVKNKSNEVLSYIYNKTKGNTPIIGVGGILTGQDAKEKIKKGAALIQIYSGFIYEGPSMVKKIKKSMVNQD